MMLNRYKGLSISIVQQHSGWQATITSRNVSTGFYTNAGDALKEAKVIIDHGGARLR